LRGAQPAPAIGRRLIGPILIKRDHRPAVGRRRGGQLQHPRRFGFVVGVRAGLPRACALKRQACFGEQPPEMRRTDRGMVGESGRRPARQRDPLGVGTGTGHRDDPLALIVGDPAGTPVAICGTELPTFDASKIAARSRVAKGLAFLARLFSAVASGVSQRPDEHFRGDAPSQGAARSARAESSARSRRDFIGTAAAGPHTPTRVSRGR
jgi:hypothetical protein